MKHERGLRERSDVKADRGTTVCPVDLRTGGFSIFELLYVVMFMSVLLSIALPSVDQRDERRVRMAADQYASAHRLARSMGIQNGGMSEFHVDTANNRYWIEVDTSSTGVMDTIGEVRNASTENPVSLSGTRSLVCFDGRGLPDLNKNNRGDTCEAHNGFVVFTLGAQRDSLEVTALGKVIR
jgi:Tfp pilus assembly protein PilE